MSLSAARLFGRFSSAPVGPEPPPAVLLVAAHPDDEVIGAGARLCSLPSTRVVHVTDGSPRWLDDARRAGCETREEYARLRRSELHAALALAGCDPQSSIALEFVDGEAALELPRLTRALAAILLETHPEIVLTHPYEGGHPDHDAAAFAARTALALLDRAGAPRPLLVEMTSYHAGPEGVVCGRFLPGSPEEAIISLDPAARRRKMALIDCYASQRHLLGGFPVDAERFRVAPRYDFTAPPHRGALYYESQPWGWSGERFRKLAAECLDELEVGRGPCG